ncbi:MAG: 3'-5' exonuclease [Flavobacteriaceae bacterium]|nr:3'-5' exonuclease [Flavobacteriaceae bacterium]
MLDKINISHILFLDIETVPEVETYEELSEEKQELFTIKTQYQRKDEVTPKEFYDRAGIWAEFGKIICISVGFFAEMNTKRVFRIKSFSGAEKELLIDFKSLLEEHFHKPHHLLCAHNGKEFDFPYIARRMIINTIEMPAKLNLFGKKPWEVAHLDTMDLWKFGDYKHFTSLRLLTHILNIPSPKDEIDGSDVAHVYYQENDLNKIIRYCEKDTIAVAQLLLRFNNLELLNEDEIINV